MSTMGISWVYHGDNQQKATFKTKQDQDDLSLPKGFLAMGRGPDIFGPGPSGGELRPARRPGLRSIGPDGAVSSMNFSMSFPSPKHKTVFSGFGRKNPATVRRLWCPSGNSS